MQYTTRYFSSARIIIGGIIDVVGYLNRAVEKYLGILGTQ